MRMFLPDFTVSVALRALLPIALVASGAGLWGCGSTEGADPAVEDPNAEAELVNGLTPEQASETLVQIGDRTITVGEFAALLADQSPYLRSRYNSPERRREFLDNQIRFELLAAEAERRGLTDRPEVVRSRKQMMIQRMMNELIYGPNRISDISDEDVLEYYNAHLDDYQQPAQVRASHILVRNRALAARLLSRVQASEDDLSVFREIAEEHNQDPTTRDRLGDLRFFSLPVEGEDTASSVPAEVAAAAFTIDRIGGVFPEVVETAAGLHIVKLTGRRAALRRTVQESSRPIRNALMRQRREEAMNSLMEELRAAADIEEHPEVLNNLRLEIYDGESPTTAPPASPIAAPSSVTP